MDLSTYNVQCPCCGSYSLAGRGDYDICPVCFWEDDDASEEFGKLAPERPRGPNGIHLWQARQEFFNLKPKIRKYEFRPPSREEE